MLNPVFCIAAIRNPCYSLISYILYYLRSNRASKTTWNKPLFHLFQNPLPRHTYTLSDCDQPCNSLRPSFHELCIFSRMTRRSANTSPRYRRRGGPGRTEIERFNHDDHFSSRWEPHLVLKCTENIWKPKWTPHETGAPRWTCTQTPANATMTG